MKVEKCLKLFPIEKELKDFISLSKGKLTKTLHTKQLTLRMMIPLSSSGREVNEEFSSSTSNPEILFKDQISKSLPTH